MWGNDLIIQQTAQECGKRLRDLVNFQIIWKMAQLHGTGLKYLRTGFTMLEMAQEFDKRFKYVGNDVYIWEMA